MKRYVSFIVATLFAFFLWFAVNLNGEYEENFKAKIIIKNLQPEKAIKVDYPEFVNLRVKGQGWKILPFYFFSRPYITIDLSNVGWRLQVNLLNDRRVHISLPSDVYLIQVEPESLKLEFDRKVEKKVPVVFLHEIKDNNSDFAYPPRVFPDSVTISGAESIVSSIESISTKKLLIEKLGQETETNIELLNPNERLLKLSHNSVRVKFLVEQVAEREFTIPVEVTEIPPDKEVILFPPDIRVVVRGTLSKLVSAEANINTTIKALVSYRDVVNDKTGLVRPRIILPEYFNLISVSPEGLEYIIRQK